MDVVRGMFGNDLAHVGCRNPFFFLFSFCSHIILVKLSIEDFSRAKCETATIHQRATRMQLKPVNQRMYVAEIHANLSFIAQL